MSDDVEEEVLLRNTGQHQDGKVEVAETPSLRSYWNCLAENANYRNLFIADLVDNIGAWLNYIATLELVSSFSESSVALSVIVLIRFSPSLVLAPLAGVLADRCNRVTILIYAAIVDALLTALLATIHHPSQILELYVLLIAQFAAIALQDPSRKAIVPVLVSPSQLHLASTLETFAWSLTGAFGASLGGTLASHLGNSMCFLIDAATYLIAAYFAHRIPRNLGSPYAMKDITCQHSMSPIADETRGLENLGVIDNLQTPIAGALPRYSSKTHNSLERSRYENNTASVELSATSPRRRHPIDAVKGNDDGSSMHLHSIEITEDCPRCKSDIQTNIHASFPSEQQNVSMQNGGNNAVRGRVAAWFSEFFRLGKLAFQDGLNATLEGWKFLSACGNRDIVVFVLAKGCGSIQWGAVDVLNVKFSERNDMQVREDPSMTLGLIFAMVGIGCFIGPVVLNPFVPPRSGPLTRAVVAAFFLLFIGAVLMSLATTLQLVLLSTFVRAIGSSTLWIYSTLLLQLRCPNNVLGRVVAVEAAFYTLTEGSSALFGGLAFDSLHLSENQTAGVLAVVAGTIAVASWVACLCTSGKEHTEASSSNNRIS